MAVTIDDVRHIASLARLGVGDDRARALVAELNTILEHMSVLSRVDTTAVDPLTAIGADSTPLRGDSGPSVALQRPKSNGSANASFMRTPSAAVSVTACAALTPARSRAIMIRRPRCADRWRPDSPRVSPVLRSLDRVATAGLGREGSTRCYLDRESALADAALVEFAVTGAPRAVPSARWPAFRSS
jgi:aspartyl-tRNA(Asn)/glutamyl-tRNA(Gln) amidotransferase subunit C